MTTETFTEKLTEAVETFLQAEQDAREKFFADLETYKKNAIKEIEHKSSENDAKKMKEMENFLGV